MKAVTTFLFLLTFSLSVLGQQATGVKAQDFSVTTLENESIELSKLSGKVVVITFWSTRCEICIEEIPRLNKLVDQYSDKEVVFVGLAWQNTKRLNKFLAEKPFKFKIVPQSLGVLLKYSPRTKSGRLMMGFPSHFVVDQQGKVVFAGEGFSQSKKLDRILNGLVSSPAKVE